MRGGLAAITAGLVLAVPAGAASGPMLQLRFLRPFVVHGRAFHRLERVRVTLTTLGRTETRVVRSSGFGTFTVDFGTVELGRCAGYTVRAIGSRDTATLKRTPLPACMP